MMQPYCPKRRQSGAFLGSNGGLGPSGGLPAASTAMPAVTCNPVAPAAVSDVPGMPHRTVVPAVMVEMMVEAMAVTVREDDPVVGKAATALPEGPRTVIRSPVGVVMVGASRQGKYRAGQEKYNLPHHSAGTHRGSGPDPVVDVHVVDLAVE
jgi:hypothetical protein